MNIFPYETIASDEVFFGREEEITKINQFIENSNNLVIFSKRRLGKSSLISEVISKINEDKKNDTLCIYVDIYDITSAEDFATLLLQGLTSTYTQDIKTAIKKLTSLFKRTRVEPTFDPNTMKYGIKPVVTALKFEELLEDFFESIFTIAKEKKIVIAIDEFQQISTIKDKKIDALFRKYVQSKQSKNISYIFLGSKRHMLTSLFEYNAPMYELATPLELTPIKIDDIYTYVSKFLNIKKDMINYIYDLCDGETKLMQHIFFLLYLKFRDVEIDEEIVEEILEEILSYKTAMYRALLDTFTLNQKKSLKLILKYKNGLFSRDVLNEQNLSKNVMQSSINTLIDREILDKSDDVFFIPDRAFELWGKKIYI
ncbi:MAG: ATP-binding protein [Epsilonproteobacteria bacterium]|nr:MAG: ATP-binding protein [Campylobacterota bacterium]